MSLYIVFSSVPLFCATTSSFASVTVCVAVVAVAFVVVVAAPSVANGVREFAASNSRVAPPHAFRCVRPLWRAGYSAASESGHYFSTKRRRRPPQFERGDRQFHAACVAARGRHSPPAGGLNSVCTVPPPEEGDWSPTYSVGPFTRLSPAVVGVQPTLLAHHRFPGLKCALFSLYLPCLLAYLSQLNAMYLVGSFSTYDNKSCNYWAFYRAC